MDMNKTYEKLLPELLFDEVDLPPVVVPLLTSLP